jgi:transcriptional regulator with XRE-family HTH domain
VLVIVDTLYERFRLQALPQLKKLDVRETARLTGHSVGAVSAVLNGKARPHRARLRRYLEIAEAL